MLTARDLRFRYRRGSPWVVDGVSLTLSKGEVVGLRGPSGSGKTTLARLLSGYETPASGHLRVDGAPLPRSGASPVQLILQHPELAVDPRWRLAEVLAEAGPPDPVMLEALSISQGWLRRYPHELSGGELQRVVVARALLARPSFVIADEVSAMLDPLTQAQIWGVLTDRARAGSLGLLAISHDDGLLRVVAHRVIDLASGTETILTRGVGSAVEIPVAPVGSSAQLARRTMAG